MNRTALTLGLTAIAAFGAGYVMRGSDGGEAVSTEIPASHGAENRGGSSGGQSQGPRAFAKGGAAKWLESLKDIDSRNPVAISNLYRQCGAMDEEEAAELLEKCAEILALRNSGDSTGTENFPDAEAVEILADTAARHLAELSPSRVLAVIRGSKALRRENELMLAVFAIIAGSDPALAIEEVQKLEQPESAVEGIMNQLVLSDDLTLADSLLRLYPDKLRLQHLLLNRAVEVAPDLAMRIGCGMIVSSGDEEALRQLMMSSATRQRAVEWALTLQDEETVKGEMIGYLAGQDFPQAAGIYQRLAPGMSEEVRNEAVAKMAMAAYMEQRDWDSWLRSLDETSRQAALAHLISSENYYKVAYSASRAFGGEERLHLAEEMYGALPASAEKSDFIVSQARSLMKVDTDKALEWLARMPSGQAKDKLVREISLQEQLKALQQPTDDDR